jgi:ATP-binding cassette subfamily C protein CydD
VVARVFIDGQALGDVLPLVGMMVVLLVGRAACVWGSETFAQRAASLVKADLRRRLNRLLLRLGPAYTGGERTGELASTLVEAVEAQDAYVTQFLTVRYLSVLVPIFVFLMVLALDAWSTLILVVAGAFLLVLLVLIGGRARLITERRFLELSWMSAFFLDILQGLATLKAFGRSKEQAATIEEISRHYGKTTMEVLAVAFQSSLVMELAATAATALVALEVSLRVMGGVLPFERALAVLLLTPEFFLPLRQLAIRFHAGTAGKAAARRISEILEREREGPVASAPIGVPKISTAHDLEIEGLLEGAIRFENVSFSYPARAGDGQPGERPSALIELSMTLPPHKTTVLVGATGAGKTTAASLLLRFIEPTHGQITVTGTPLASIEPDAWRTQVAWVPQRPHLFHGTLAENLRLAKPDASLDELIAAAKAANADEFIRKLPQGYDTPLGERGARLSGGQAQRLAIGRAFLKGGRLLILDEATAHLDARNEELIQEALERLIQGRTVLIIAHRLKLAYDADQVVVMEGGRAVESGRPAALLRRDGAYGAMVLAYERGGS